MLSHFPPNNAPQPANQAPPSRLCSLRIPQGQLACKSNAPSPVLERNVIAAVGPPSPIIFSGQRSKYRRAESKAAPAPGAGPSQALHVVIVIVIVAVNVDVDACSTQSRSCHACDEGCSQLPDEERLQRATADQPCVPLYARCLCSSLPFSASILHRPAV